MDKKIGIIVIALVVFAAGAFMVFSKKPVSSPENAAVKEETSTTSGASSVQASIKSLIGAGRNVTCDVTYTDGKGSGKIFVADKKFRGDFDTNMGGVTNKSHMIQDGTYAYVWTEDKKEGTKFSLESMMKLAASPNPQAQQSADLNSNVDMKCSSWGVDNSKLTPPADVTFQDMSAILNSVPKAPAGGTTTTTPNSSYCSAITDPQAKAACISATSK